MALPTRTLQQLMLLMLAYVCIGPATLTNGRSLLQGLSLTSNKSPGLPAVRFTCALL
jgi:hypothetical protein